MRSFISICFSAGLILTAAPSRAQDHSSQAPNPTDEVIVEGQIRGGDPAMSAFLAGDYETAEIEFKRNFRNLKRTEFMRDTFLDSARLAEAAAPPSGGPATGTGAGSTSVSVDAGLSELMAGQIRRDNDDDNVMRSGSDKGYQLYMTGLSQIQLNKYEDARENMRRALGFNSTLHDARVRLSLLDWHMTGSPETAREQLSKLQKAREACHAQCARSGQDFVLDESINLLSGLLAAQ